MRKTGPRESEDEMPRMVQIPLDDADRRRLAKFIERERREGRKLKPGPAAGYLLRRGLGVEESDSAMPRVGR